MPQFIDHAFIDVRSGDGGNGVIAWRREKYEPAGGPAGGNGGRGGHVYIEASKDLNTLIAFKYKSKFQAANGQRGGSALRSGKSGLDLTIKVPVGTLIRDADRGEVLVDLSRSSRRVLVAEGGKGGRGNAAFSTPTRRAPHFCEPGEPGVSRRLELELKLLADVSIVGFPNAGKSTLLKAMSQAKPKIAQYPFSTLEPNLGVVRKSSGDNYVLADIPGLIEGASEGAGLGHDFLRHIERTCLILHVVDISSEEPSAQIAKINQELKLFSEALSNKLQLIVLNKIDLLTDDEMQAIQATISHLHPKELVIAISAATGRGVDQLAYAIEGKLALGNRQEEIPNEETIWDENAFAHPDDGFVISRRRKKFFVEGDKILRLVGVTDKRDPESLHHLNQVLKGMGVIDELIKQKVQIGDEVHLGSTCFTFGEDLL